MTILLTGANGLIGRKIIEYFSRINKIRLIATSKGEQRFRLPRGFIYESFNITDKKRGFELFRQYKPEIIINSAAITQADECELNEEKCRSVNVEAVQTLVDLSNEFKSFFLQLSTDFVFNGNHGPYREEDLPDPVSIYGLSKWDAEKFVLKSPGEKAIARTILVYGYIESASRKNLVTWVIDSLTNGKVIKVVSDQIRTPTLAEDVASGCCSIALQKHHGLFHIAGKDTLSPYEMAVRTARFFKLDESLIEKVTTSYFPQPAKRPMVTGLVINKAMKILKFKPHSFEEGLGVIKQQLNLI